MQHIIIGFLIAIALVVTVKWIDSHQNELVKHDANLINHHNVAVEALNHIHEDVEKSKQIALDNSKKLDILLNIATNVNTIVDK